MSEFKFKILFEKIKFKKINIMIKWNIWQCRVLVKVVWNLVISGTGLSGIKSDPIDKIVDARAWPKIFN